MTSLDKNTNKVDIDPREFGKVAVVMGGTSAEREVSLNSGKAVINALANAKVDAHAIDAGRDILDQLIQGQFDRVFIALHGRGGEDGTLQGALDILGIPYTGSGVMGCAIAMDKLRTKQLWNGVGLPTPRFTVAKNKEDLAQATKGLGLPVMVKPALEGSSIGISKISAEDQIQAAWDSASGHSCEVLVEAWVQGKEYTASILGDQCLPIIRLETPHEIYDYDAKYISDTTGYFCPSGLSDENEVEFQKLALNAFKTVGASGWGRVDFMVDQNERPWLIEVNTVPGLTSHSLVPMAAKAAGYDFTQLVLTILTQTLKKTGS